MGARVQKPFVALLVGVAVLVSLAPPARAQEPGSPTTAPPTTAPPAGGAGDDAGGGEAVRGTLDYEDEEGEDVPAPGVELTVESEDGTFSEVVETDEDGRFEVPLPASGPYRVTIDPAGLPEDVSLRDEDQTTRPATVSPGESSPVLFRLVEGEVESDGSQTLERALDLLVEGIRYGLIIGICAIGLSLVFGTTGLINFAHGEMVTFGAVVAWFLNVTVGLHLLVAAPLAVVVGGLAGLSLDRGFWRPLQRRGTGLIALIVITIGLGLLLRYVYVFQFGGRTRPYAQYTPQLDRYEWGPVSIVPRDLVIILLSLGVLVLVAVFLQRSRTGKAMRAVADNRELAEASGIDVERVVGLVWAAGGALAAMGGVMIGLSQQVSWEIGLQLLLLMFAGVILGGIGTAYGALVGSLVVGMFVQMSTLVIANELKNVGALLVLILIMMVRPQGIFGQAERVG